MKTALASASLLLLLGCAHKAAKTTAAPAPAATNGGASHDPPPAAASGKSLYDRLGGQAAIEAVVSDFMKNVAADERINAPFAMSDLDLLHKRLVEFVCVATGGPCQYTGRGMKEAHHGMGVTAAQFDAIAEDLVRTLDTFHVPEKEKSELLGAVGPLKKDIVEAE